jgi:hypothetical protein
LIPTRRVSEADKRRNRFKNNPVNIILTFIAILQNFVSHTNIGIKPLFSLLIPFLSNIKTTVNFVKPGLDLNSCEV